MNILSGKVSYRMFPAPHHVYIYVMFWSSLANKEKKNWVEEENSVV